ncbi:MAG: signal peptidase I [Deltaproteobacteria bacterium]|jgi:signal peptidase I|nr:signal peptidase I [Deltaproteobacteria bacterium]
MTEKRLTAQDSSNNQLREFIVPIIQILLFVFIIRMSLVEPFKIPSESMVPTLLVGDHILVNKLSYGFWLPIPFRKTNAYQFDIPERGAVVVFTRNLPKDEDGEYLEEDINLIKRVIALPGETIQVTSKKVWINGKELTEPWTTLWLSGGNKDFGPETVPDGQVFVMGDNRDRSRDSRFWSEHFVPINQIKGRAFFIYFNSRVFGDGDYLKRFFSIIR